MMMVRNVGSSVIFGFILLILLQRCIQQITSSHFDYFVLFCNAQDIGEIIDLSYALLGFQMISGVLPSFDNHVVDR